MESCVVNGNDFFDVYRGMKRLVERARNGEGNRCGFLECKTHRADSHMLVGDTQIYRDAKAAWAKMEADDCIKNFERRCLAEGWLEEADFAAVQREVDAMIEKAKRFAVESPYPDASELFTDLYD
jgi:pyruvate dehydrogenase E1 component alpha subunit